MDNIYRRNRGVQLPHLDKIKKEIRDKVFASEKEINEFINNLNLEINQSISTIEDKKSKIVDQFSIFQSDSEYYLSRKEEIQSLEIPEIQKNIDNKGSEYVSLSKKYKDTMVRDFSNVTHLFNYDNVILSKTKNKIEKYHSMNDEEKTIKRLKKNEEADKSQQYSRLNVDDYSSIMFYNQIFIPFSNTDDEILMFKIKLLPANYHDKSIKNNELGAFYIKFLLRGGDIAGDFIFTTTLENNQYTVKAISEGLLNLGEDYKIKTYLDREDNYLYFTIQNINSLNDKNESELSSGNTIMNIGVNIILGGEIIFPEEINTKFDNTNNSKINISSHIISHDDKCIYGPLNISSEDKQYFLSEDDQFGSVTLYRINTIESDINQIYENDNLKLNKSHVQYSISVSEPDSTKVVKIDEVGEILIRSLMKLNLLENVVYKCFGFVLINYMYFPIVQLKLTKKIRDGVDNIFETSQEICGLEMLFDPNWCIEQYSKDLSTSPTNNKINSLENGFLTAFPGLSLEGSKTFKNFDSKTQNNNDTPNRNVQYGSINISLLENSALLLNVTNFIPTTNNFASWNGKNAKILISGYDLTLIVSDEIIDTMNNDLEINNMKYYVK